MTEKEIRKGIKGGLAVLLIMAPALTFGYFSSRMDGNFSHSPDYRSRYFCVWGYIPVG